MNLKQLIRSITKAWNCVHSVDEISVCAFYFIFITDTLYFGLKIHSFPIFGLTLTKNHRKYGYLYLLKFLQFKYHMFVGISTNERHFYLSYKQFFSGIMKLLNPMINKTHELICKYNSFCTIIRTYQIEFLILFNENWLKRTKQV